MDIGFYSLGTLLAYAAAHVKDGSTHELLALAKAIANEEYQ